MHELSIAQSIVDTVVSQAEEHQAARVLCVRLRIGELSAIVEDSLAFSFEMVARDTRAEGARLEIETVPWQVRCTECRIIYRVSDAIPNCPACKHVGGETVSGRELQIVEMDVE